jgi:predicted Zn-dependent protease with MMP-like domain
VKDSRLAEIALAAVAAAQRELPAEVRAAARAVPVHCEPEPGADVLAEGFPTDLLGLFAGDPHGTELAHDQPMPPQILLYVRNLWDYAEEDVAVFRAEARLTYLHELGHYLGWDEDEVEARGLS